MARGTSLDPAGGRDPQDLPGRRAVTRLRPAFHVPGLARPVDRRTEAYGLSSLPAPGVRGVWLSMVIGTAVHAMTVLLLRQSPGAGLSRRR